MKYVLLYLLLLSGCAIPKGSVPYSPKKPPAKKGIIYIYRGPSKIDGMNPDLPLIYVNGESVGKLGIGGHYAVTVEPGETEVRFKTSTLGMPMPFGGWAEKIKVVSGQKYFVKFAIEGLFKKYKFGLVPADQGDREIRETLLIVRD